MTIGPQKRDPDRLFPTDPTVRAIARELHARVAAAPIISPHGHVPAELLDLNERFADPATLLVTHDHYVTRLLHADGLELSDLGVGPNSTAGPNSMAEPREIWRALTARWHLFAGTASGYWLEEELSTLLGVDPDLRPETADAVFDAIDQRLTEPEFRPRALFETFKIDVLATTDDPLDDLAAHRRLAESDLPGRVLPTFRPDRFVDAEAAEFANNVARLVAATGNAADFEGYLAAMAARRAHFIEHGAVSADHGVASPDTADLDATTAAQIFARALAGTADDAELRTLSAHLLFQQARLSVDDGLVMTIHAGVRRNHSTATLERYGPNTGHDIPIPTSFVDGLRPLLEKFGLERELHLILFSVDEAAIAREVAPLAGFYPLVFIGAPWWFLDAPDAMARHRAAVTEVAGFSRGSGFIDDTRAFLSIPTRHDTARRVDAGYLARLVAEGRMRRSDAERIIDDSVDAIPRRAFKLS